MLRPIEAGLLTNSPSPGGGVSWLTPRQSSWISLTGFQQPSGGGYDDRTFQTILGVPRPFDWVQVVLTNILETEFTFPNVAVAVSGDVPGDKNPSTGTWVQALFNGGAAAVVPARRGEGRQRRLISDRINISSIARTDGGSFPILFARAYVPAGAANVPRGSFDGLGAWADPSAGNTFTGGRFIITGGCAGNKVAASQGTYSDQPFWPGVLCEFIFGHNEKVFTLGSAGDSIVNGDYDDSQGKLASYGHYAVKASHTPEHPVIWSNHGFSGQGTANFLDRLNDFVDDGLLEHLTAMLYPVWSPNDDTDIATWNARVDAAISILQANHVLPVLVTPTPRDGFEADPRDNERKALRDLTLARASAAVRVFNIDASLSDQATPAEFIDGYTQPGDGVHPNPTGASVAGLDLANGALGDAVEEYHA